MPVGDQDYTSGGPKPSNGSFADTARVKPDYQATHVSVDTYDWVALQDALRGARERAEVAELDATLMRQAATMYQATTDDAMAKAEAAEAACAAMREALELVAGCANVSGDAELDDIGCARCLAVSPAHEPWCEVGRALAPDAGQQLLVQIAAMRASIEELVAAMLAYSMDVDDSPPGFHLAMMERAEAALAPDAGATLLAQMAVMEATILDVLTNWWDRIYPEDIFIGLTGCDEGVSEVVRLRKAMRDALAPDAGAAYQREHERLLRLEAEVKRARDEQPDGSPFAHIVLAALDAREDA